VSLREIGAEAGQRNTGAVRYHFGSKEELVNAVFEHRMVPINARRLAILDELDATGRDDELRGLTEAYLYPLAEMLGSPRRPSWYLRFCIHAGFIQGSAPQDLDAQPWTRGIAIVRDRFLQLIAQAGVPEPLRHDRWALFSGHLTHALADRELMLQLRPRGLTPRAAFLSHLADTAVSVAAAGVSAHTISMLDDRRSA